MSGEKELFNLAKSYVAMEDMLNKNLYEAESEEIRDMMQEIRDTLLNKKYSVDKFIYYKKLYKEMTMREYFEFVKTLE